MKTSRRDFLRNSVTAVCAGGILPGLVAQSAAAADTSGYKAMVCIFLYGGIDNNDIIIPRDMTSYDRFASTRQNLLATYAANELAGSRLRDDLLPLLPNNSGVFGGLEYGLASEYEPLVNLFNSGECAVVGSVGPLIQEITREQFNNQTVPVPKQLFSHNDQQSTWMALGAEGSQAGWGGRFIDRFSMADASFRTPLAAVSTNGNSPLLGGGPVAQFALTRSGPIDIDISSNRNFLGNNSVFDGTRAALLNQFKAENGRSPNVFVRDFESLQAQGVQISDDVAQQFDNLTPLSTQFNNTNIEGQLKVVAEMISLRDSLDVSRQVFFVGLGGFDTHNQQAADLPRKQREIADGIKNFRDAMVEIGAWNDVTVFTAADFGRTLNDNGNGTDHGWGGHHFVAGGSVRGKRVYGSFPDSDIASPNYTDDRGRLIPSVSVEQYASTLGAWFGLTAEERQAALPNLGNFNSADLGFMQI
ncbi:MAG: DUF1501 domain-containing protein [Gammaproteobacteria bacterium]